MTARTWDADWEARRSGRACPMCAEGRPDESHGNSRIFAGGVADAYLVRDDVGQPGYTIVIWRGPHVADPTELSDDDAARYFAEVLVVARALEAHYRPAKLNLEMLGNSVPHLHTHVIPRYVTDDSPGQPASLMRLPETRRPPIARATFERDVAALRSALAPKRAATPRRKGARAASRPRARGATRGASRSRSARPSSGRRPRR